jgi:hypothetical protein
MAVTYKPADDTVREMAQEIIRKSHPGLEGVQIRFMFRSKASKRGGAVTLGSTRVISGLAAVLATPVEELQAARAVQGPDYMPSFFVIDLAEDYWADMAEDGKKALIDHELCHCGIDPETGNLGLIDHDVQEFTAIIERHGIWKPDLAKFAKASKDALQGLLTILRPDRRKSLENATRVILGG